MSATSTSSPTERSPARSASTSRRRVGSARISKISAMPDTLLVRYMSCQQCIGAYAHVIRPRDALARRTRSTASFTRAPKDASATPRAVIADGTATAGGIVFDLAITTGDAIFILYATRVLGLDGALVGAVYTIGGLASVFGASMVRRVTTQFGIGPSMSASIFLVAAGWALVLCGGG